MKKLKSLFKHDPATRKKRIKNYKKARQNYHIHKERKRKNHAYKKKELDAWKHSSKFYNIASRTCLDILFYVRQIFKAFMWILVCGMMPKFLTSTWLHSLVAAPNIPAKVLFAEFTNIHYYNILIAGTTLFALYHIVIRMRWTPPTVYYTHTQKHEIRQARKIMKHNRSDMHKKALIDHAENILDTQDNINESAKTNATDSSARKSQVDSYAKKSAKNDERRKRNKIRKHNKK